MILPNSPANRLVPALSAAEALGLNARFGRCFDALGTGLAESRIVPGGPLDFLDDPVMATLGFKGADGEHGVIHVGYVPPAGWDRQKPEVKETYQGVFVGGVHLVFQMVHQALVDPILATLGTPRIVSSIESIPAGRHRPIRTPGVHRVHFLFRDALGRPMLADVIFATTEDAWAAQSDEVRSRYMVEHLGWRTVAVRFITPTIAPGRLGKSFAASAPLN